MLETAGWAGRHRWSVQSPLLALAIAATCAVLVGILAAAVHPLAVVAALIGLAGLVAIFSRPVLGLFGLIGVIATLPFGVIPVRLGVQLTFVDLLVIATLLAFVVRLPSLASSRNGLRLETTGTLLLLFILVAIVAFVQGTGYSPATAELIRRFAKLLASLLMFVVVVNLIRERATLFRVARALMLMGACAGSVGAALWLIPPATQLRLLTALGVLGYPTSDVLRYVPGPNDTYTTQLRAIGTSVDPNVFGGTLMLALALIGMQWVSRDRLFSRPVLLILALATGAGFLLSFSRAVWLGLAVGAVTIGAMRYRRVWLWLVLGIAVLLALPIGQDALDRFVGGFSSADPATALRLGEYRNALTILQRYPWLGIGFGASPDIDVTAGVSSVYLLVGEQTGLLGFGLYVAALLVTLTRGIQALRLPRADERLYGVLAGLAAGLVAALVAGFLDHYFANQVFPHAVALFWLYAALVVVASREAQSDAGARIGAAASGLKAAPTSP